MKKLSMATIASSLVGLGAFMAAPAQAGTMTRVGFDEFNSSVGYGDAVTDQWKDDYGVTFETDTNELWLYQSTCKHNRLGNSNSDRPTCTGGDWDLATGIVGGATAQDNVLIIQENLGADEVPDDKVGGTISFDFTDEGGVFFDKIGMLDFDEAGKAEFRFWFDGQENPGDWISFTKDEVASENADTPFAELLTPDRPGNNSLRDYHFGFDNVTKMEMYMPGSGAVAYFDYGRPDKPQDVPEPASLLGLLAVGAMGAGSVLKRKQK